MDQYVGKIVIDLTGEPVGEITDVIFNDRTLQPEMVDVTTGRFVKHHHFVPVDLVAPDGERVLVKASKSQIQEAPGSKDHVLDRVARESTYKYFNLRLPDA